MANPPDPDFEKNVFINCPFDSAYKSLLRPLLFTILYFDFNPKIASERSNSAEQRIDKICEFIESSKYSIHDLSRLKSMKKNEFARHNMPFELGIDYGSRKFAENHFGEKSFLVLEKEKYDYSKALSDFAGADIKSHNDEPELIIRVVRNWFVETVNLTKLKPSSTIWNDFNEFMADFDADRRNEGFKDKDIYDMPTSEFTSFIKEWLQQKANPIAPNLGSTATITGGEYSYTSSTLPDEVIKEFNFTVKNGEITRDKNGRLVGYIIIRSPVVSAQRLIEKIGADKEEFVSEESEISTDSSKPTIFTSSSTLTYPRGTTILGYTYEQDVEYRIKTILKGYLKNLTLKGTFDAVWETDFPNGSFKASGIFEIYLS
jgi:hypothetical protein